MGNQSQILRFLKKRQAKDRSTPLGTIGFLFAAVISILISVGMFRLIGTDQHLKRRLPSPSELEILLDPISGSLLEPTQIYGRASRRERARRENTGIGVRRYTAITDGKTIFYSEVPEYLILATLAAVHR